jgi:SAM-dependent methyltransferase
VADAARDHRPRPTDYDAELRLHHEVLRRSWDVRPDDPFLDIGCGTGQTTREVAQAAVAGGALGSTSAGQCAGAWNTATVRAGTVNVPVVAS